MSCGGTAKVDGEYAGSSLACKPDMRSQWRPSGQHTRCRHVLVEAENTCITLPSACTALASHDTCNSPTCQSPHATVAMPQILTMCNSLLVTVTPATVIPLQALPPQTPMATMTLPATPSTSLMQPRWSWPARPAQQARQISLWQTAC